MRNYLNIILVLAFTIAALACKPRTINESALEKDTSAAPADKGEVSRSGVSAVVVNPEQVGKSHSPSFEGLDKEMMDALAAIPPPSNRDGYDAIQAVRLRTLERKKDLLFSVPVDPPVKMDLEEAWEALETSSFFNNEQSRYVTDLMQKYSEAPQLEKLVIWRLIKLRMDAGLKRGSATAEEITKMEMAEFLFSALGIDRHELFEAIHVKTRSLSEEAGRKGDEAEEEIIRIYKEQSAKADKILESHVRQSP
ncbi:MAG: hypothetical protein EOP85_15640 [Verrucomicrobiaceae bacterium]|nr:MAG: hypothetical protein EOP85_15640 [Verrucomicrobiaceae bacterium]